MAKSDFNTGKTRILSMPSIMGMGQSTIRDISPTYWFSALQPTQVIAPPGYKPRQWAFNPGANLIWQPKGDSPITFANLRALADGWDLLRLMIEQRKDELCSLPFEIRAKKQHGETNTDAKQRNQEDPMVQQLNDFFAKPDGVHPFPQWMRLWVEDMMVIDAVALWFARDKDGKVATIHPLAGDTINRMLTDQGLTPDAPSVAYQQVVYGTPVWNFSTDDMLYFMANERTDKRYGYSKVEQIIITINIGIRRQIFQLNYYTDGNMPEAMVFLPSDLPIDRVKEVQEWFDLSLAGDLAARRRITFLPGYGSGDQAKPNVVFPKEVLLKDAMDEWLVQTAAFCIGVSAQPFLKMANRASAEEANDAATEGGLGPDKMRVITVLNECLERMGVADKYEFAVQEHREPDVLKQAQADDITVGKIMTVNESREARGLDPRSEPEADMLGTFTATGFVPLDGSPLTNAPEPTEPDPNNPDGKDDADAKEGDKPAKGDKPADGDKSGSGNKLFKAKGGKVLLDASRKTKTAQLAQKAVTKAVKASLTSACKQVIANIKTNYKDGNFTKMKKALRKDDDTYDLDGIIAIDWDVLPDAITDSLMEVAMEGATFGLGQLKIDQPGMISKANKVAGSWAEDRAAELVGKKWSGSKLIDNPDAQWAISDSTRDRLKTIVASAFDDETPMADLIQQIQDADIFDPLRAETIARTEVSMAQNQGNLLGWKQSGLVESVDWVVSSEHELDSDCDCQDNADNGPYDLDEVPDFPAHPNCMCNLQTAVIRGGDDD